MNINQNITDFERNLYQLKDWLRDSTIPRELRDCIESLIHEYDTHLEPDIEVLLDDRDNYKDQFECLEEELKELKELMETRED